MNKKILFISVLAVGILAIGITSYYYSATPSIVEYVALYTSISTACYAILAEQKAKTEPILRINPELSSHSMGSLGLDILIENIGYSIAKDIEVNCKLVPDGSIPLSDNGVFKHSFLAPREPPIKYSALMFVETSKLLSQEKLIIEVSYLNEDDKKQKPIKMETTISKLEQEMRRVSYT
jgi:hypothetical protein